MYEKNITGSTACHDERMVSFYKLKLVNNSDHVSGEKKTGHLRSLENAPENLKLFKADLLDYDATAAAIAGCQGVFHVASPVPSSNQIGRAHV